MPGRLSEQIATAKFLRRPDLMKTYMADMQHKVSARLRLLYQGIMDMSYSGLPWMRLLLEGFVSEFLRWVDRLRFQTNKIFWSFLLLEAGVAVVPFQTFDMPVENGWFRMSVGTCKSNRTQSGSWH